MPGFRKIHFVAVLTLLCAPALFAQDGGSSAPGMDEINRTWMESLHGKSDEKTDGENGTEQPAANENGEPVRMQNPGGGDGEAEGEGNADRNGAAPQSSGNTEAATDDPSEFFPANEGPSFLSVAFRFFALMALMVGLFYLGMRYLRAKSGVPAPGGGGELVNVLVSTPLVQGKFLQIVDVAGRLMVLGVSDAGVQMLGTIDDGVAADRIRIWQSRRSSVSTPAGLLDRLNDVLKAGDFRFWAAGDDRRQKDAPEFAALLKQQIPRPAPPAAPSPPVDDDAQYDAFGDVAVEPAPEAEDDLKTLLKQQKKRLAARKGGGRKSGD